MEKNIEELKKINVAKREQKEKSILDKKTAKFNRNKQKSNDREAFSKKAFEMRKERIERLIQQKKAKYSTKIELINKSIDSITNDTTALEKEKIDNSWSMKRIQSKIKKCNTHFDAKRKQINYDFQIAKITQKEFDAQMQAVEINESVLLAQWEKKGSVLQEKTSIGKLKHKLSVLMTNEQKEISNFEKRIVSTSPSTFIDEIKDKYIIFKSNYVFGKSINSWMSSVSTHVKKYSMFYILAFIVLSFAILTDGKNITGENIADNIVQNNTYILIIGLGMLMVIVAGYIDLSVGALLGFCGALSVILYNNFGSVIIATSITVVFGMFVGFVQGTLIGYFKMPAFIVTLATQLLFLGLIISITKSITIIPAGGFDSQFVKSMTGHIKDITIGTNFHLFSFLIIFSVGIIVVALMYFGRSKKVKYGVAKDSSIIFMIKLLMTTLLFAMLAYFIATSLFGLKYFVIYIMILVVVFTFIMQNTTFGRNIYAIGGNKKAAELSGINAKRTTVYVYMTVGGLTGFASVVYTAVMISASPSAGAGYELDVISSVFVGGASMAGGIGTVTGTVIGGFILGFINNGLQLMQSPYEMQKIIKAIVLLAAVGYDIYSNRKIG